MLPPASVGDEKRTPYQFTIVTDWGNLSAKENFAEGKEGINNSTNVQPLGIAQADRP